MIPAYAAAEKRAELVRAAQQLLHERGFERTSLAAVARRAAMPLGNVYYYFKTKEALADAVIAAHERALRGGFAEWERRHADPRQRLRRLALAPLGHAESVIEHGCPHGSLCQELQKLGSDSPLARAAARLFEVYLSWCTRQYRALGYGRRSRSQATELVAALQGTMLLAQAMRSQALLGRQLRHIAQGLGRL